MSDIKERLVSHIPKNQRVIEFLYTCYENTQCKYRKKAYTKAIHEVFSYWHEIEPYAPSNSFIKRKINTFLESNY